MLHTEELMVLTKIELAAALHKEVRILLHLAGKLDIAQLDYRPTSKQRSAIELLRYLSFMGPALVATAKNGKFDADSWKAEVAAGDNRNLEQTLERDRVAARCSTTGCWPTCPMPTSAPRYRLRRRAKSPRARSSSAWSSAAHAAYRTQLFMDLKACGQEHLGTVNHWRGTGCGPGVAQLFHRNDAIAARTITKVSYSESYRRRNDVSLRGCLSATKANGTSERATPACGGSCHPFSVVRPRARRARRYGRRPCAADNEIGATHRKQRRRLTAHFARQVRTVSGIVRSAGIAKNEGGATATVDKTR